MKPFSPLPIEVVDVMLAVEKECKDLLGLDDMSITTSNDEYEDEQQRPTFFDCALCNYYPDGEAACKFHTDPEHGSHWHRTTCVVSCGSPRKFAFRPIPDKNKWSEWDDVDCSANGGSSGGANDDATAPAAVRLFPGDVVLMTDDCNDVFHHAVYADEGNCDDTGSRVSLVLKRALDRGGGQRGHGLAGEGRRARRRQRRE
mmetsp:Transcript_20026/g.26593  ORF Transcript_20026/g.26593 Transcript_20026/m.26593 type:complete len:201 (+) Transcript_20026:1-603(+)